MAIWNRLLTGCGPRDLPRQKRNPAVWLLKAWSVSFADGTRAAVAEVNSETDFVPKNEDFQVMVREVTRIALEKEGDKDAVNAATYPGGSVSVEEHIKEMVGAIGENMSLRRCEYLSVGQGVVASYIHNVAADGLGKIGVLVALESGGDAGKLAEFGKKVAMHIAATSPLAMNRDELDPAVVEKERAIFLRTGAGIRQACQHRGKNGGGAYPQVL